MISASSRRILLIAGAAEGGLGLFGIGAALLFGVNLCATLGLETGAAVIGVVGAAPMVLLFLGSLRSSWPPLVHIREKLDQAVLPFFAPLPWWGLALLALLAGAGEELLFRGFLQPVLSRPLGAAGGLLVASVLFGLVHWITPFYALFAAILGVYLGALFLFTDSLLAAAVAHAVYDFVALAVYLGRSHHDVGGDGSVG